MIIKVNDNGTIKSCNVPDVNDIPTKVSDLTNDSGYLTEHQDISGKANIVDLATVASSGSYNDLLNKPTIPTKISDLTDDSNHYIKPSNGIPASDLADGVIPNLTDYVKNTDYATTTKAGIVKVNGAGLQMSGDRVAVLPPTSAQVKAGTASYAPIGPALQHEAAFYGLAKAAGNTTQSSSNNAVGVYTDEAKSAIQDMLDVPSNSTLDDYVKNTDYATSSASGVVKINSDYGVYMRSDNTLGINAASDSQIKAGTNGSRPIVSVNEHSATFYGLAKAAGDTTQSSSSNAVGTYTNEAKSAIRSMLGVENATVTVEVQGASPTITALSNVRYTCGEVTSITITPSQIGICDVIFTSGSTPAILTLPNTVKMPDWVDLTILEANTIYEINIVDGIYGTVMTWTI